MSRNFRASQLLDAFDFSSTDILEQLRATFTNVHSGTNPPANTLGQDGNIYFDATAMILYVREAGDWVAASSQGGGSVSLTALLDQLAAESLYTYTPVDANDYIAASGDSFYDGTNLVLTFRAGYTVPQSLYGFMTAPTGATGDEPDLVIHLLRTGITISGNTTYYFSISRGTITNFEFAQMLSDIPTLLQNLYTRGAGSNPQEYLTKMANGDYEFTELVIPAPQQLRLNQVTSWPEGLSDRTFNGVQISAAGAITFANNADASDFFNDIGPTPREGGGFVSSALVVLLEGANVRLLAPIGTPVGIVNNIVTFTGATTVATSTPVPVTEVRGSQFEGSVNGVFDIPATYFATSTGNNLTLTIPATDADRYNNFRRVLSVLPTGRFVIANDEDGTKAFYTVALNTNDATNVILDLTALSSIASGGQVGLEGRTTPAFSFTLPTTGNVDVFNIGNVEARTNRFIDHNDTPMTYNGRANQLVRVNSTGTGLEFFEQTFDPIATITPTTAPNNEVDWTPLNEYDAVLFNNENLQPTQTVAGATNSQFTGTQRATRNDGTMNPFLATAINAIPDGDLALTNGDYYVVTFPAANLVQNLNGQILIFRAENIVGNNLPQSSGQITTQRFLNDNIGTVSVGHSGDIPFTIRHYPAADVDLPTFNRDAVDLSVTSGSQSVNISGFSDATPGINARIANGDRIFLRIDNGADDTYLEVLSADSSAVVVNLAEKFTVDARNFTSRATDTRRIILDPNANDMPVHNELYEHEVTQAGIPAITDVNGLPVLQADITAEEVKTLLEVDEAAIIDNAGGAPTLAPNVTADGIKNLLDLQLDDLSDVTITPTGMDFTSVANPIDADNSADGDYTTSGSTFEIIFQNAGARAGFTVGLRVAFTLATTALADVPSNILFTGTITISEQNLNLGERIVMTVDSRYRSFFTGGTFTASADGFTVPASTIETWRAWSFTDSDLGVGVFDVHGDLSNQSISAFRARLNILEPAIIDNTGTPMLDSDITATEVRDLLNVDISSGDQVTFTTGFDPNDQPTSHTYPGVTVEVDTNDPNVATFTFASQSDAFAFFAITGARANNGTSTREVTVTYGATTLVFPVGTMMGPAGGATLDILNRSVVTGGLVDQATPTDFVIVASATLPVHITSNLFDLEGTGGVDVDIDPANSRITIDGSNIIGGGSGTTFPTSPDAGESFYLTAAVGNNPIGFYYFNGTDWVELDESEEVIATGTALPATGVPNSLFYLSEADDDPARGRVTQTIDIDDAQIDTASNDGSLTVGNITQRLMFPDNNLTGTTFLVFPVFTLTGLTGLDEPTIMSRVTARIQAELDTAAATLSTTNPWTITHQNIPGTTNRAIIATGRLGITERVITGSLQFGATLSPIGAPASTVVPDMVFHAGLYLRGPASVIASNRDWILVALTDPSSVTSTLTFVSDDTLNMTGTARSFGNVEVDIGQTGSTEFSFTNTGDADEFRAQFLTRAGSLSTVPITIQYVDDTSTTIRVTVPVGTPVTPYDTDNNVLVFFETGFTAANNTSINLEDLVPDTIHTNELHITSPMNTISSDVLELNNNDTLTLDIADNAITPNRIALETGQSHAPGNLLVTGPQNTGFSTTPFRNLVPHAFATTDQFITWDSRCTFSEGSIDRDGVTVSAATLGPDIVQGTLNSFGLIQTAGSRTMSSGFISVLNNLTDVGGGGPVQYESNRMYTVQFVPNTVTTPPATLGDSSIIDAIPGAGGVADLTAGQILVFRTGAIPPATGDLPTNQEWANDNLNIANFDWQRDVRIVIRDYGQQGSLNVESRANEAFLLSENTHVTIPLRTTLTPESILAFNTARGTESPMHDVYTSLPAPNGNVLIRIFSIDTNEVVLDRSAQLIDDQDGTFTQANLTDRIKMSPTNQNLFTFSPHNAQDTVYVARNSSEETHANILQRISTTEELFSNGTLTLPVHGTLNSREVHRISGAGTRSDSFTPQLLQFTLSVPTDYEVATTGSTLGTLYLRAAVNTPIMVNFAVGNTLFIDAALEGDDRSLLEGARISPNPNGFPETTIVGRPGGTINVNDGSIFNTNDQIYVVTDVNPTIVVFDLAGGAFGTLGDSTVVTTADLTLMPRMTAAEFLTELGRVIRLTWPTVTIDTAARANPTDSTLTEIVFNTNQTGGITLNFALNDTTDESAVTMTAAGTTIGSQFRVSFTDPMVTNRNFSIDIADTQSRTLTQLLDSIAIDIARETPDGWTATREGNDIVLVSVLPTPSTSLITTSVTNAGDGDITLSAAREIQGGRRATAVGNGLNISDTGIISTTSPAFGVVSAAVGREDSININVDGTLTVNTAPDPGAQSQAFVNQLFATNPTQGDLVSVATDKDNYLILIDRDDVIFIPRGTLISYTNSTALVTLGTVLRGQAPAIGTDVELRDALAFDERIDLFAGPGIQFETSTVDESLTIRTRSATNPVTDAQNLEAVADVQNSAVRFADWLLTNGFGFPERGSGMITISDNIPTASGFSYYQINGQNYYYIDELNGGSWIIGIVTNGTTYTTAQLNPRVIISFGT